MVLLFDSVEFNMASKRLPLYKRNMFGLVDYNRASSLPIDNDHINYTNF